MGRRLRPKSGLFAGPVSNVCIAQLQVVSVIGVAAVPVLVNMSFLFLKIRFIGFGVLMSVFLQWIPGINPVRTRA